MEYLNQKDLWIIIVAILWTLPWKGYALWTASKNNSKRWFIVLILLNTFAILDIFYIFYIAKKTPKEMWEVLRTKV